MCKHILLLILLLSPFSIMAQNIDGTVTNDRGEPLEAAVVRWHDVGFYVLCDEQGKFSLPARDTSSQLEISYVGYKPVFIDVDPEELVLDISITGIYDLVTVDVAVRQFGQRFSTVQSRNMEIIGASELKKAACCNLAESFETNVGVDVSAQDAVSGAKEIRMLGLQGLYAQMMLEGRPTLDGLPYAYALEYIPGP